MIPRRVKLKGFMSFRDEAELHFDGAPIWVLSGPNAAGKSAIFDAIAFALYGVHRTDDIELKGTQDAKKLINQQSNNLEVEYEFALGDDVFCAKRTVNKLNRSTYQIFRPQNGNGTKQVKPVSITGTESKAGFNEWVQRNIGLDSKAFTATVLLGQNKSDALLRHKTETRHQILSKIIDISAYERLLQRAEDKRRKWSNDATSYNRQLGDVGVVDDEELDQLTLQLEESSKELTRLQSSLEELIARKQTAQRWNELIDRETRVEQELKQAQELISREDEIQRNAERWRELQQLIPCAERYLTELERLHSTAVQIAQHKSAAERWEQSLKGLIKEQESARERVTQLTLKRDGAYEECNAARSKLLELSPQLQDIKVIEDLRKNIARLDNALLRFPVDLDQQRDELSKEIDELTHLSRHLLSLRRLYQARNEWFDSRQKIESLAVEVQRCNEEIAQLKSDKAEVELQLANDRQLLEGAKQRVAESKVLLEQAQSRQSRFTQVLDQSTCDYCGQQLTAAHLEKERKRIEQEVRRAEEARHETENQLTKTSAAFVASEQKINIITSKLRRADDVQRKASEELRAAQRDFQRAEDDGKSALGELPETYLLRIAPNAILADVSLYFQSEYLTDERLASFAKRVSKLDDVKRQLTTLQSQTKERDKRRAQREPDVQRLNELNARYSTQSIHDIQQQSQTAEERREANERQLREFKEQLKEAERVASESAEKVNIAQSAWQQADSSVKEASARHHELARTVAERETELSSIGVADASKLTREEYGIWQTQAAELKSAGESLTQLNAALSDCEIKRRELIQIRQEIERIPDEARCAIADVSQLEVEVRERQRSLGSLSRNAEKRKHQLESQRAQLAELQEKYKEASGKESLYKELCRLLGREYLQRHLLQQAEVGIVERANEVLNRISNRTLRLELVQSLDGESKPGSRNSNKAFDLMAYYTEVGDKPIPVDILSGSQRVRVAVSLALGIGRFAANQNSHRIESVIIDEGFGSLDKDGRRSMLDELRLLKDDLKRIILVSWEDEIAEAFRDKYRVELADGSSRAYLLE